MNDKVAPATGAPPAGRFRPRPTRPLGVLEHEGWLLKRYEIRADARPVDPAAHAAAVATIRAEIPPATDGHRLGFTILHRGEEMMWLLVELWHADILHLHMFSAPLDDPTAFAKAPPALVGCVWELAVVQHEREAYVAHVLNPPDGPDERAYLEDMVVL